MKQGLGFRAWDLGLIIACRQYRTLNPKPKVLELESIAI